MFKQYPKTQYDLYSDGSTFTLTDITRGVVVDRSRLPDDSLLYTYYQLNNGDRPDVVSHKLYGDVQYYWTFFIINEFLRDGLAAWQLSSTDFNKMIATQYGKYSALTSSINTFNNLNKSGLCDLSLIPLSEEYLPYIRLSDESGGRASIVKYDGARHQLIIEDIHRIRAQVETATIMAPNGVTTAGNLNVTVTGARIAGSPLVIPVALLTSDNTAAKVAAKVRTALLATAAITAQYNVGGTDATYTLTSKTSDANDDTLNMNHTTVTPLTGILNAATSVNSTIGDRIEISRNSFIDGSDRFRIIWVGGPETDELKTKLIDSIYKNIIKYDTDGLAQSQDILETKEQYVFGKFIEFNPNKNYRWAEYYNAAHEYYAPDGSIVSAYQMLSDNNVVSPSYKSFYTLESELNDEKRALKVIRPDYIGEFSNQYYQTLLGES